MCLDGNTVFVNQLGEMMMMKTALFSPSLKLKSFKEAIDVLENGVTSYLEHRGCLNEVELRTIDSIVNLIKTKQQQQLISVQLLTVCVFINYSRA